MNRTAISYWILFTLCLLLIIPAMAWLSYSVLELDRQFQEDRRQTELARREVELQEKITSALYRMDWKLGPHIAREAAQPYYMYESFYQVPFNSVQGMGGPRNSMPSPLLYEDAQYVKLHFQVGADGIFTSPRRPISDQGMRQAAACCNIRLPQLLACDSKIEALREFSSFEILSQKIREYDSEGTEYQRESELVYATSQIDDFIAENSAQINDPSNDEQNLNAAILSKLTKSKLQNMRVQSRGGKEFLKRKSAYDDNTTQWAASQRLEQVQTESPSNPSQPAISRKFIEGVMRPVWIEDQLLLVRQVEVDNRQIVQGCWLDWTLIQSALRDEVEDILPQLQFEPLLSSDQIDPGLALVTLPVQLVVDTPELLESLALTAPDANEADTFGVPLALFLAWLGLALSAVAIGALLLGVIRLSERRASFVSAVTHELRTPLTTFKMYSEMLADEMVPPEKQKQYAKTLSLQSDRLSHLVENVLQFARLERGSRGNQVRPIELSEELPRIVERLQQRCQQADMRLHFDCRQPDKESRVRIELHSLEQILFNLIDNACKYAAQAENKTIELMVTNTAAGCDFEVRDYGPGVDPKFRKRLFQPFCKSDQDAANSAAGVGLGLALCQRMATELGGKLRYTEANPGANFVLQIPSQ